MIDKLRTLKKQIIALRFNDKAELDAIQRKSKMYLSQAFSDIRKVTYSHDVDRIEFEPTYSIDSTNKNAVWEEGRRKLSNLLDTAIEELILEEQRQGSQVFERIVTVQDDSKVIELTKALAEASNELQTLRSVKRKWRISWTLISGIAIPIVSGAFFLGKYFGESKFDQEKLQLFDSTKILRYQRDTLIELTNKQKKQLTELGSKVQTPSIKELGTTFAISVSFFRPTSIMNGEILITAREQGSSAALTFQGIQGLSKTPSGRFDSTMIEWINKGDRFYIKDSKSTIWCLSPLISCTKSDKQICNTKLGKHDQNKTIIQCGRQVESSAGSRAGGLYGDLPPTQFISQSSGEMEESVFEQRL